MTKNFLLAASALTALAFAGAAQAGTLTTGSEISNIPVRAAAGETTALTYQVATERNLPNNGIATTVSADNAFVFDDLDNEVSVAANASGLTFVVTYNLTGPARFSDVSAASVTLGEITGSSVTPVLSNSGRTLQAFVTINNNQLGATAQLIDSVALTNFNLAVTAKEAVGLSYTLAQVVGGQTITLDTSEATNIVTFRSAFANFFKATTGSVNAALPTFATFSTTGATNVTVGSGGSSATTNALSTTAASGVRENLLGGGAVAVTSIITSADVTVAGPQVTDLQASLGGQDLPEDATATSAVFELAGGALNANLTLAPAEDVVISEGSYSATIVPTYAANWSGTASVTRTLVNIGLDGTNFYAPWFGLGGTAANSTLRIGNNGTAATGPIVITLKARNGTSATATKATFPGVPANGFRAITGAELRAAFGTDAANADLLVSIQSTAFNVVSAKVRTTQPTGQIFENTLDLLRPAPATAADVSAVSTAVSSVQSTVNEILDNQDPA